jgi:hypothetical protein
MPRWTVRDVAAEIDSAVKLAAREDRRSLNGEVLWLVLAGLAARAANGVQTRLAAVPPASKPARTEVIPLGPRPVITDETPIGPDVDLDAEKILLADGTRLTNEMIPALAEEIRQGLEP